MSLQQRRFRPLRDPLFMLCLTLYAANRWILKPLTHNGFFHTSLNDVICLPFWIPLMLWLVEIAKMRPQGEPPRAHEILIPLVMWSFVFEVWLPQIPFFSHMATADASDILSYTTGAVLASWFWRFWYRSSAITTTESLKR